MFDETSWKKFQTKLLVSSILCKYFRRYINEKSFDNFKCFSTWKYVGGMWK